MNSEPKQQSDPNRCPNGEPHEFVTEHRPGHLIYWVRQCMICHTVDWDFLDREISTAVLLSDQSRILSNYEDDSQPSGGIAAMSVYVIAPDRKRFEDYVKETSATKAPHAVEFCPVTDETQLHGLENAEIVIIDRNDCPQHAAIVFAEVLAATGRAKISYRAT